jgi:hypothetical protein
MGETSRIATINHNGRSIIYADHSGLAGDELLNNIKAATKKVLDFPLSGVLFLANFEETYFNKEVKAYIEISEDSKKFNEKCKKQGFVGLTKVKKLFFNAYCKITGKEMKSCDTLEEAKDYLVS